MLGDIHAQCRADLEHIQGNVDDLIAERDAARQERDTARQSRQHMINQYTWIGVDPPDGVVFAMSEQQYEALKQQAEQLVHQLYKDLAAARQENERTSNYDYWVGRAKFLEAERDAARRERDDAQSNLADAIGSVNAMEQELSRAEQERGRLQDHLKTISIAWQMVRAQVITGTLEQEARYDRLANAIDAALSPPDNTILEDTIHRDLPGARPAQSARATLPPVHGFAASTNATPPPETDHV